MKFSDAIAALEAAGQREAVTVLYALRARSRKNRRPRRAPVSRPFTPEVRAEIARLHHETDLTMHQIAAHLGVNQGRVSEALAEPF